MICSGSFHKEASAVGWWYELRGSSGNLLMFGTSYASEKAATEASEVAKKNVCQHWHDVRIRTGFTALKSTEHSSEG
jgi:hypothetical protein